MRRDRVHELGDVVAGKVKVSQTPESILYYKSLLQEQYPIGDPIRRLRRHSPSQTHRGGAEFVVLVVGMGQPEANRIDAGELWPPLAFVGRPQPAHATCWSLDFALVA